MSQRFFCVLFLVFISHSSQAFVTSCINYDVLRAHPDDLRVPLFIKCMRQGSNLWIDGGIDPYLIDELRVFSEEPIRTIYLNSGGGLVKDAFELAQFIRDNSITTVVREHATCASACTLLFQAGVERIAHKKARFMYHSARFSMISGNEKKKIQECLQKPQANPCHMEIQTKKEGLLETTKRMFAKMEEYGAQHKLQQDYFSMPKDPAWWESGNYLAIQDWWIQGGTLKHYGVVTELEL